MDNFGSRLQTYITPEVTCNYTFYIASDDNGGLSLSSDINPSNKLQIAYVRGWTSSRQWDKYPEQQSPPIFLEKGIQYYLEAIYKEGGGGDRLAIAWECSDHNITLDVIDASHTRYDEFIPTDLVSLVDVPTSPLQRCEGDCNSDADCDASLECFIRTGTEDVLGCNSTGAGTSANGYCAHRPWKNTLFTKGNNGLPAVNFPLGNCEVSLFDISSLEL